MKITLEFTQAQFNALINLRDETEAAIGMTEIDTHLKKQVRLIDRMLKSNRYVRE